MELQIIEINIYEIRGQRVINNELENLISQSVTSRWGGLP